MKQYVKESSKLKAGSKVNREVRCGNYVPEEEKITAFIRLFSFATLLKLLCHQFNVLEFTAKD